MLEGSFGGRVEKVLHLHLIAHTHPAEIINQSSMKANPPTDHSAPAESPSRPTRQNGPKQRPYLIHGILRGKELGYTAIETDSLTRRQLPLVKLFIDALCMT